MARIPFLILSVAIATTFFAGIASASTYSAHSYNENNHAVWLPDLNQRNLNLDDGATFTKEADGWNLKGSLTSATDGSRWLINVDFTGTYTASDFGELTGYDDSRIKGTRWNNVREDWSFADTVTGTISAQTGEHAGRVFGLERSGGSNDYLAQFGTCLNDKNCDVGLSSWITLTDQQTLETFRGDINLGVSNPVPEPSAALIFGLGTLIAGSAARRRER